MMGLTTYFKAVKIHREALLDFLIAHKVIRDSIICRICGSFLTINRETLLLRCSSVSYISHNKKKKCKVYCGYKIHAFHGTWFDKIRLNWQNVCRLIAFFLYFCPPHKQLLMDELDITGKTAIDWISFCREVTCHFDNYLL